MKWMKWFYDMKIGNRLLGALIFGGCITAAVGVVSVSRLAKVADLSKASYEKETLGIAYLKQANIDLIEVDRAAKNVMLSNSSEEREQYKAQVDAYIGLVTEDLEKAKPLMTTDKGKEQLTQAEQAWKDSQQSTSQVVSLALKEPLSKKRESVELSFGAGRAKADAAEDLMAQLATTKEEVAKDSEQQTEKTFHNTRLLLLGLVLWGVIGSLAVGVFIARSISKPLGLIADIARKIAHGEVEQKIDYHYNDEVGVLAESFRGMIEAVNALTRDAFMLAEAAVQGRLATRADASQHHGDYRKIVEGVNDTLDAVIGPLNVSADYVDKISKGAIPAKITDPYNGDFNTIKNNLNILIVAMNDITNAAEEIANGNLTVSLRERSPQDKLMQALGSMVGGLTQTKEFVGK